MSDLWTPLPTKEAAIEAMEVSDSAWIEQAYLCLERIWGDREDGFDLTSDSIWTLCDIRKVPPPKEPKAMACVLQRGQRAGLIQPTDRTKRSVRKECHGRPVRCWRCNKPTPAPQG
jgi:hypothetical protein